MISIHIAGTNGKGSVAEYLSSIITAAGKKCGLFTSPHLISHTERLRIDEKCIGETALAALLEEVEQQNLAVNGTVFAAYTAAAVLWFERQQVDYTVYETGIGGRLDPTNSLDHDVVVLTPIDYDHTDRLGDRLSQIAAEKCGIIKRGIPVYSALQHKVVTNAIRKHCDQRDAPLVFIDDFEVISGALDGQSFIYDNRDYHIRSIGEYQPQNAALAVRVTKALRFHTDAISTGLANTNIKCRTQYFAGSPPLVIDGAHNPSSVDMLVQTLDRYFAETKKVLLFACMEDKNYKAMVDRLGKAFCEVIVTQVGSPRSADPAMLSKLFAAHTHTVSERDALVAFANAITISKQENALLVICGSLYLAGLVSAQLSD